MNKEFIPHQEALELKELGFNELCLEAYDKNGMLYHSHKTDKLFTALNSNLSTQCSAPLYQQAFRWFREKHRLVHEVQFGSGKIWVRYGYNSFTRALEVDSNNNEFYHTYEEAELACLKKLIEIVKGGDK
jgi:hypothetical protein